MTRNAGRAKPNRSEWDALTMELLSVVLRLRIAACLGWWRDATCAAYDAMQLADKLTAVLAEREEASA